VTVYSIWNQAAPTISGHGGQTATAGAIFTLSQPAALTGIWYYSDSAESALPTECAIWDVASKSIISSTHNASPSWSGAAGSGWVKCTYNGSVTLDARADGYVSTVLINVGSKAFQSSTPYPVTSGIITAPVSELGLVNSPYQNSASLVFPGTSGGALNWFVDVEVTSIAYTQSYTLHNQEVTGYNVQPDTTPFTLGVQFSVSQTCSLNGIWFLTPAGGTGVTMPDTCVIYNADTTAQVAGTLNTSPTWTGAPVGSGGWAKCAYNGAVTLVPGIHYYSCVFNADAGAGEWFAGNGSFWTTGGGGAGGITNGPLSAPNNAGSVTGQAPFNSAAVLSVPNTSFNSYDWGVDVEVTIPPVPVPVPVLYSMRMMP
jgi:hypothetical protein